VCKNRVSAGFTRVSWVPGRTAGSTGFYRVNSPPGFYLDPDRSQARVSKLCFQQTQDFEMPSVLWLSTSVSFFHPLETLSLPIERPPTVLLIPLSPNSSPQWLSLSSSFHRLWFSWFLTQSISSGIFLKYRVYFSFFLCLIFVDYYALSLIFSYRNWSGAFIFYIIFSCSVSVFLLLYFFSTSIFFLLLFFDQYLEKLY